MLRGLDRLERRLADAARRLDDGMAAEMRLIAARAEDMARELAPAGRGAGSEPRLRDSFYHSSLGTRAVMGVKNPHAAYVEFGTGRRGAMSSGAWDSVGYDPAWAGMPARPYMQRTADIMRREFAEDMARTVRDIL